MNLVATRWWSMLFMPSTVLMAGAALGLLLVLRAWARGRRPSQARGALLLASGSLLLLYLLSTPLVARAMARALEDRYPPVDPTKVEAADAIVVLGGGTGATRRPDGSIHVYSMLAADRFESGMAALAANRAPFVVFGGGSVGVEGAPSESQWFAARAAARGVPADRALTVPPAIYTSDEGEAVAEVLRGRGARRIILCTSAMHLPRAAAHYRALGFEVVPLPCDFSTRGDAEAWSLKLLVPRSLALARCDACAKEWLGMLAAPLRPGADSR